MRAWKYVFKRLYAREDWLGVRSERSTRDWTSARGHDGGSRWGRIDAGSTSEVIARDQLNVV